MLRISADFDELDLALIHGFLSSESYWAAGIPFDTLDRALRNSICVSGHLDGQQVAFARAVTDQATFAYLADVFVIDGHRGNGLGKRLVKLMVDDGPGSGFRWTLFTSDAHGLYRLFGFGAPDHTALVRPAR